MDPNLTYAALVPEDYMSDMSLNYAGEFDPKGFEIIVESMTKKEKKINGYGKHDEIRIEKARGFITFKEEKTPEIKTVVIHHTRYNPDLGYLYIFQNDGKWYKVKYQ
jgi:hypothetical protein